MTINLMVNTVWQTEQWTLVLFALQNAQIPIRMISFHIFTTFSRTVLAFLQDEQIKYDTWHHVVLG